MIPEEFYQRMREIARIGDEEIAHREADDLMCQVLREYGFDLGVNVFEDMPKWYA